MSQTVIFSIGALVFALTVWGVVMAGGIWLGHVAESEDGSSPQGPAMADGQPDDVTSAPDPT